MQDLARPESLLINPPKKTLRSRLASLMGFFIARKAGGFFFILCLLFSSPAFASDLYKITAYCSCVKCCGKSDGITASGYKAKYGYVACNWLPFGTLVEIEGLGTFKVMDRGAKSLFGDKNNHIKHLDIYMPSHLQARIFGVKWREVKIRRTP